MGTSGQLVLLPVSSQLKPGWRLATREDIDGKKTPIVVAPELAQFAEGHERQKAKSAARPQTYITAKSDAKDDSEA